MPSRPARLLCIGKDLDFLQIRCDVLSRNGYDAKSVALPEAEALLRTERFDLIIVSAWLKEREIDQIVAAAGKTPALVLTELTLPSDLLAQVERLLTTTPSES